MAGLIDDFISVLETQAGNYANLLGLSREKKDAVLRNDIEYLQKITELENTVITRNQRLDKKRGAVLDDIALVLNKKPADLTFAALLKMHEGMPEYDRLAKVQAEIKSSLDALKIINEQNNVLIKNSLEYIEFSMNVIRGSMTQEAGFYGADGEQVDRGGVPFFDAKQ